MGAAISVSSDLAEKYSRAALEVSPVSDEELERVGDWILKAHSMRGASARVVDLAVEMLQGKLTLSNALNDADLTELVRCLSEVKSALVYFGGVIRERDGSKK